MRPAQGLCSGRGNGKQLLHAMVPQWAVRSLVRTLHLASDLQQLLVVLVQVVPVPHPVLLHERSWLMAEPGSCWHLWEQTRPGMGVN